MTESFNGVMTVILRYFTDFCILQGQLLQNERQNSFFLFLFFHFSPVMLD